MPFDLSKPIFFGPTDMPGKQKKSGAFSSGLGNLSLAVNPALKYKDMPFDCGNFPGDRTCCFNSLIGYPQKNGIALPIFEYEAPLIADLENDVKYLWVKKSRGSGFSELMLRYMTFLILCRNYKYKHSKMFVVCSVGEIVAIDLIKRMKDMILSLPDGETILEDTEKNVCRFLNVEVIAKPGNHVGAMRGFPRVSFMLIDEASHWTGEAEAREIRSVAEGYIAKSAPIICMISTPNVPGTMFEKIGEEKDSLYKRYLIPYTMCIEKPGQPGSGIYTEQEIALAKLSPTFEREMNLKYSAGIDNLFEEKDIDAALIDEIPDEPYHSVTISCDPAFGSSNASYCITAQLAWPNKKVIVLEAKQFQRESFRRFSDLMFEKFHEYHATKMFIDASQRDVVDDLKMAFRERTDYEAIIADAKANYKYDRDAWMQMMTVVPISFNKYNDRMLNHLVYLINHREILIPRKFDSLILDLRKARQKEGKLDKTGSTYHFDLLDALRMACLAYEYIT